MFLRRLYYDIATSEIILSYMCEGNIRITTVQEDFEIQPTLQVRNEINTGYLEWRVKDETVENNFSFKTPNIIDGELFFTERVQTAPIATDPDNTYGVPDETYHAIIDDYTMELLGGEL